MTTEHPIKFILICVVKYYSNQNALKLWVGNHNSCAGARVRQVPHVSHSCADARVRQVPQSVCQFIPLIFSFTTLGHVNRCAKRPTYSCAGARVRQYHMSVLVALVRVCGRYHILPTEQTTCELTYRLYMQWIIVIFALPPPIFDFGTNREQ